MRVLIIGLGSIAGKHINVLKEIRPDVELFALRSQTSNSQMPGVANVYDYADIGNINPEFILISNPPYAHFETITKVIPFGIPLFIEKPVFESTSEDKRKIVKDILKSQIVTYVGCNLRFLDCICETKRLIKNKRINEVNVYCGSYLPEWRKGVDWRKNYSANKELGGGVNLDLIHELDYIYWLFGYPKLARKTFASRSSLGISSIDYANYLFEYDSFAVNIVLNYYRRDPKRQLEIITKDETFTVNLLKNEIMKESTCIYHSKQEIKDTYFNQMVCFLDNILTKKDNFNSIDEAYNVLELCI